MTEISGNPALEHRRIGRPGKHPGIVIAFKDQAIRTVKNLEDVGSHNPAIGQNSQTHLSTGNDILHGFACIMWNSIGSNRKIPDAEPGMTINKTRVRKRNIILAQEPAGSVREIDRHLEVAGKAAHSGDVVAVLMGNQDGGDFFAGNAQPGKPAESHAQGKSAINEQLRFAGVDNQGIPAAAAPQRGKTHHFN